LASQDLRERRVPSEGEWAASEAGISYLQLATLRLSGRFSSGNIVNFDRTPRNIRRKKRRRADRTNTPKGSGWEPIFPRGWNKVEGEAEEGVVVSSVSACGRWGGCGQSRERMGWGSRGVCGCREQLVVEKHPRSLSRHPLSTLLHKHRAPATSLPLPFRLILPRSLVAPTFQTVGPVTELAGQIQAMHNNRSPRKLWGWMVSGRIKQGSSLRKGVRRTRGQSSTR
ncbi:hypothetical protein WH47_00518, partial [Habropoda laboriosa]